MENSHRNSRNAERKRLIFSAASLIKRFDENPPLDETYNRAAGCYEVLLDLVERPEVSNEVSDLIKQPSEKIRMSALKIVNVLLFNDKNDPFISLGLANHATDNEIKRRWKRLLMLYHPDKLHSQKRIDEAAKKINQAFEELKQRKEKNIQSEKAVKKPWHYIPERRYFNTRPAGIQNFKYLRYLPALILIAFISFTLFIVALFIIDRI
jgi:hypothetical protein